MTRNLHLLIPQSYIDSWEITNFNFKQLKIVKSNE
jgi:hypothetical protein